MESHRVGSYLVTPLVSPWLVKDAHPGTNLPTCTLPRRISNLFKTEVNGENTLSQLTGHVRAPPRGMNVGARVPFLLGNQHLKLLSTKMKQV